MTQNIANRGFGEIPVMSDQLRKQWCRMVRAVLFRDIGTVCFLVEKAPGDGKKTAVPRKRIHQTHLFSILEKKN